MTNHDHADDHADDVTDDDDRAARIAARERREHDRGNPTPLLAALWADVMGN